ncbi:MAG: 3-isopropylmalate dehydratase small subunit [Betaproteobacteria bacterium]|nr:3-isopropylmalate dehydratase small subunit [Betaproteobacteria bacterium]
MDKFSAFTGIAVALPHSNIDTDQIIPKQFLRSVKRTGFGDFLFNDWRYLTPADLDSDIGKLPLNPDFPLNQQRYKGAQILICGPNFGCGSSREHAVWALAEFGFRAVVSASFGDIFQTNAAKNGLLPVAVTADAARLMLANCQAQPGYRLSVDLEKKQVVEPDATVHSFAIEEGARNRLLAGLDDIAATLQHSGQIKLYEQKRSQIEPWLFAGDAGDSCA